MYCGDQYCSYHGTTIQLTQLTPNVCISGPSNVSDTLKHNLEWSPTSSPHKLGKTGPKRLRNEKSVGTITNTVTTNFVLHRFRNELTL